MARIVVFSGAGVSAESGLKTFRDSDGLWENYNVMEVATPEAWSANPELVLEFYNKRREQVVKATPNEAHYAIAKLEEEHDVTVITQNIDDLHERAGSSNVLHLHGEIRKSRSVLNDDETFEILGSELNYGDTCKNGGQLRPHVVWFGEAVPAMDEAIQLVETAEFLVVVGTSLNVYPAANLIRFTNFKCKTYLVDPKDVVAKDIENLTVVKEKATSGIPEVARMISSLGS